MILLMISELTQNPQHLGMWAMLVGIAYYTVKHFWGKRKYETKLKSVEAKMESDDDSSIGAIGAKNPGRTTVELVEVVHEDLTRYRNETRQDIKEVRDELRKHGRQIGRIEGRLGIEED